MTVYRYEIATGVVHDVTKAGINGARINGVRVKTLFDVR
jgi:hypothetical protein